MFKYSTSANYDWELWGDNAPKLQLVQGRELACEEQIFLLLSNVIMAMSYELNTIKIMYGLKTYIFFCKLHKEIFLSE